MLYSFACQVPIVQSDILSQKNWIYSHSITVNLSNYS